MLFQYFDKNDQNNLYQDIHIYNQRIMVDIHHYLHMLHSHNNLLLFRNSYLSNQFDTNIQMFRYMFLKKEMNKTFLFKINEIPLFQQVFDLQGRLSY
jgi:hypothetical protein